MGRDHTKAVKHIESVLSNKESEGFSIFAFGSRALGMGRMNSDFDLLLSTKNELTVSRKKQIQNNLSKFNYNILIFSEVALSSPRPVFFLESTAIEGASRYGQQLTGTYKLGALMSEKDFACCRLIQSLGVLIEWQEWILFNKKTIFSNSSVISKEFCLMTLLVWYFENKIPFTSILSFSHFVQTQVEKSESKLSQDELWKYLQKSGQLWGWVDSCFLRSLSAPDLDRWARIIGKRLKIHLREIPAEDETPFCREFMLAQKEDRIFKGLEWETTSPGSFKICGGTFGVLMRLALGLSERRL